MSTGVFRGPRSARPTNAAVVTGDSSMDCSIGVISVTVMPRSTASGNLSLRYSQVRGGPNSNSAAALYAIDFRYYLTMSVNIPSTPLAVLPTPVVTRSLRTAAGHRDIAIKRDDLTGELYGGNKVRKLEFLLQKARDRGAQRVATFGTVASNHALATALYANSLGFDCTCFLSNQFRTQACAKALNLHLENGTEIVRYGGSREARVATLRRSLRGRRAYLIPPGGSSWLGAVGFVDAGLELAAQIEAGETPVPERIYVANGTMGTAVGLSLGTALAGLDTEVHAVRVTDTFVASPEAMQRLLQKTASMLHRHDKSVPADLAQRARYVFREGFFGDGYAKPTPAGDRAIEVARDELGLSLEATYTGKAMAAMLQDLDHGDATNVLFWNTYNSRPLQAGTSMPADVSSLPESFLRYFY